MKFLPATIFNKTFLLIMFCINLQVFAQDEYKANVIPPSPDAAALGKFVEVPVSYYTGIPQISIPIYTIQTGNIQLPISISYHASGVKVEDVASRVGLGWALNAGGVISRSVVGCPDEGGDICSGIWGGPDPDPQTLSAMDKYRMVNGQLDMQPDMFFFNFGEYSGKIYIDRNGDCMTIPHTTLKIEPGLGPKKRPDGSWVITAPDGKKYTFATTETSRVATVCGTTLTQQDRVNPYISSWYLSKIEEPSSSRSIVFNYSDLAETVNYTIGTSESFNVNVNGTGPNAGIETCASFYSNFKPQRLESIYFDGGYVRFNYTSGRLDLKGASRLNSIEIRNQKHTFLKRFDFKHDYFHTECGSRYYQDCYRLKLVEILESSDDGTVKAPYEFKYNEFTNSDLNLPARNSKDQDFWGYYNDKKNLTTVPYIYQNGIDLTDMNRYLFYPLGNRWINTEATSAFILEEIHYPTGGYTRFTYEQNEVISTELKNKTVPKNVQLNSSMTEEEIPFTVNCFYEPGAVVTISYYKSICDPDGVEDGSETIDFNSGLGNGSDYFNLIGTPPGGGTEIPVDNIGSGGIISIINRSGSGSSTGGSGSMVVIPPGLLPPINGIPSLPANIIDNCDQIDAQIEGVPCEEPNYCPIAEIDGTNNSHGGALIASDVPYRIFLPNGSYKLLVHNALPQFDYDIKLDYENEIDTPNKYAGGLRIKRITQYDPDRNKEEVRNDFYYEEDGLSTGTIMFLRNNPYYHGESSVYDQITWGASSAATMANTNGSIVGYKKVTVLNGINGVNGKTEYYYTSFEDFPDLGISNNAPYTPLKSMDWQRGLLDRQITYRRTGQPKSNDSMHEAGPGTGHTYDIVSEIDPHYTFNYHPLEISGVKMMIDHTAYAYIEGDKITQISGWTYHEGFYEISTGWSEMDYSIEYLYSDQYPGDVDHAKIVRTDYQYNPTNLQVQQITTQASDSKDTKKSIIVYPCDYLTAEGDFIEELNKNHIINIPIETVEMVEKTKVVNDATVINNYVLGGMLFTYKPEGTGLRDEVYRMELSEPKLLDEFTFSNQHSLGAMPWNVTKWAFDVKGGYKLEHSFLSYDTYGNLLSEAGRDGITTNYEWDANNYHLYPIKKTVNPGSSNEQITLYGYKLLVGLISQTDPNGKTIKYQYDGLGRLKAILDHEDNLVKAYDYQYKVK
jgi:YD repeat-containing protein